MHLPLLFALSLFSLVLPSLGSPADVLYVEKVLSDYALITDSGSFSTLNSVFTTNLTFDFGGPPGIVKGLVNLEAEFTRIFPPGTISQTAVSTKSISLSDFDDQGSASQATTLSYITETFFGKGNLTGQIVAVYARFEDTLIKTKLRGNDGWRIATRINKYFVSWASSTLSGASNR